jgi:hypothetical protein
VVFRVLIAATLTAALALAAWSVTAAHRELQPPDFPRPRERHTVTLTGPHAESRRLDAIRRAPVRLPETFRSQPAAPATPHTLDCRFVARQAEGTSAKFDCTLGNGDTIKVKYGRNPEIHAETAAAALLTRLGYPADTMTIVDRLRCYGCPRFPFATMKMLDAIGLAPQLAPHGYERGYTDFESVSVEHRFAAPSLETDVHEGWGWFELQQAGAHRADVDALRLLAVFLAHWDNKSSNQRLVCLDASSSPGTPECREPLLMIQDLGSTFGPTKTNLGTWRLWPVWIDRRECLVTMRHLPFHGGTFPDARISEAGRQQLLHELGTLSAGDVRQIFLDARFPAFQRNTSDGRALDAWTDAFMDRVAQIRDAGPCHE